MKKIIFLALVSLVASCLSKANNDIDLAVILPAEQLGKAYAAIASHVRPTVVSVFSEKIIRFKQRDIPFPFGDLLPKLPGGVKEYKIPQIGTGSGMLLDHQGNILTNYHLVQNVDEVTVQLPDQKKVKAKVIGVDARTDVAIIRIQTKGIEKIPVTSLGDSDAVQVGDVVIAVGAPFGLAQTVTHGIISAKGRSDVGLVDYEDFLQTDAPINPGNSGGPLVNTRGEVIGMNSAIASSFGQSNGVGFAIPSNMIKVILPRMIKGESITRGELGVAIQNLNDELALHFGVKDLKGVIVSQVVSNSSADKAGIKVEDIITKYDGKPIVEVRTLRNLVAETMPGSKIKVELIRNNKKEVLTVTIGKQNNSNFDQLNGQPETEDSMDQLGLKVETLTKELSSKFRSKETVGVVIVNVEDGSIAALAGLQMGDVMVQVNHQPLKKAEEFLSVVSQAKREPTLLLIKRKGASLFVSLQVD